MCTNLLESLLLAALPLVAIVLLMVLSKWSAAKAGTVGCLPPWPSAAW